MAAMYLSINESSFVDKQREMFAEKQFHPLPVNAASKREKQKFSTAALSYMGEQLSGDVSGKRMIRLLTNGPQTRQQPRCGIGSAKEWLRLSANERPKSIAFPTLANSFPTPPNVFPTKSGNELTKRSRNTNIARRER